MSVVVIRADVSHAAVIATIGKKTFRKAFEHAFNCREELFEYLEYTYDTGKLVKSMRKENNVYLLAWKDGEPIGFAKIKKHSLHEHIESGAQMELQKLYVLHEYQGCGAGTALLKEARNLAKENQPDYLWLDTPITNEKAIRLYERNGFKKIGRHFFNIGTQTFEYYVMGLPVALKVTSACQI
jgi:diamine N-acetyltransferase